MSYVIRYYRYNGVPPFAKSEPSQVLMLARILRYPDWILIWAKPDSDETLIVTKVLDSEMENMIGSGQLTLLYSNLLNATVAQKVFEIVENGLEVNQFVETELSSKLLTA